eukprot:923083-Amorphochlora_amoeboformis.AAC.1
MQTDVTLDLKTLDEKRQGHCEHVYVPFPCPAFLCMSSSPCERNTRRHVSQRSAGISEGNPGFSPYLRMRMSLAGLHLR